MAMLVMNDIFQRTWGERAGARPAGEYWPELIGAVRATHPGFLFMAEAYWDLEWELQQQGFDYCYDKKLYDRLEHGPARTSGSISAPTSPTRSGSSASSRTTTSHGPRQPSPPEKARAAALLATTLPGAALLHEGQFEGRKVRLPVFLARRPDEPPDAELRAFYAALLGAVAKEGLRSGRWSLCEREGWPDNQSCLNIVAWCWARESARHLIIVNLGDGPAQARVRVPGEGIRGKQWHLVDLLNGETWDRDGDEMGGAGLYFDLAPWKCSFFRLESL